MSSLTESQSVRVTNWWCRKYKRGTNNLVSTICCPHCCCWWNIQYSFKREQLSQGACNLNTICIIDTPASIWWFVCRHPLDLQLGRRRLRSPHPALWLEADQWFRLREAGDVTHRGLQVVHSHLQPWIYIAQQNQRMIEHRALCSWSIASISGICWCNFCHLD